MNEDIVFSGCKIGRNAEVLVFYLSAFVRVQRNEFGIEERERGNGCVYPRTPDRRAGVCEVKSKAQVLSDAVNLVWLVEEQP